MTRLVARSMKPVVPVSNISVVFSFPAVYKDRNFITSAFFPGARKAMYLDFHRMTKPKVLFHLSLPVSSEIPCSRRSGLQPRVAGFCLLIFALLLSVNEIAAQDAVASSAPFKLSGWVESGITANPESAAHGENFGHLFTDRANEPLLNQLVISAERTLNTTSDSFEWGFKAQLLYGSDARYIHSPGHLR